MKVKMVISNHTWSVAYAILVLLLVLISTSPSMGKSTNPACQANQGAISLLKIQYGDEPSRVRAKFVGFIRSDREEAEDEVLPGGGPTTFCVSWDGRLFYIADPLRAYPKDLNNPPDEELKEHQKTLVPWVQVYDRHGRWVRTIHLSHGFPTRIRVDEQGRLYVNDLENGVAIYRADGTYDEAQSRRVAAAYRAAINEYNLSPKLVEFFEVDRQGCLYFLAHQIAGRENETNIVELRLLVIYPDNTTKLIVDFCAEDFGIDRYRGEIITVDSTIPTDNVRYVPYVVYQTPREDPDNILKRGEFSIVSNAPYKRMRPNGEVVQRFKWELDISSHIPNVWDGFAPYTFNLEQHISVTCDESKRLYRVFTSDKLHWVPIEDRNDPRRSMDTMDGFWIIEFTPDGRYARARAKNICLIATYSPLPGNLVGRITNLWDVDREGNVYWLEFHSDHLEVKMTPR